MNKYDAKLDGENKIVTIRVHDEKRRFKVFSRRSGQCLELLVKQLENGITSVDMKNAYNIDDNKLFDELKNASGFKPFMNKENKRRDSKDVWKLDLKKLWSASKELKNEPIWFGKHKQTDLKKFEAHLLKKYGECVCNISKFPLIQDTKRKFVSNMRKPAIDHRRPKLKGGEDKLDNLQFLSHYINEMKNQQCAACEDPKCEKCALAFPERSSIIYPTKEDISYLEGVKNNF
jgi:hypothetical protein